MPAPNLADIQSAIAAFDKGPLGYSLPEAKDLRKLIYHAMYYDDQGWQKLSYIDRVRLTRAIVRIKSIEPALYDPSFASLP